MAWRIVRKISVCAIALVAIFGILDNFSLFVFDADAATSDLDASATIGASATIALNTNNVAFSILPSSEGTFGKSNALVVSTYTNNDYNCDVTMIADSANLTNGSYTIPSLEAGSTYTESTFTNNSWGYQIESGNYKPIIATEAANPIKTITTMTGSTPDTTNIYFAAKFTTAVKAGDYTNTITFASTCTPEPRNYMQDQTQATLATLMPNVGDEVTLYDKRDEKSYTVAHLADGNYWMTQNLDHEIVAQANYYTPQNTDIPSAWTPSTATYATGTTTWDTGTTGETISQSYDPGDLCWDGTINEDWDGTLDNETTTCGSDKHMHIGNYYNWTVAVAMNDSSSYTTQNTDVDQSICPAGWRLPIGGTTNTGSKSFQYLWNQYSSSFDEDTMMNLPLYFSYAGRWDGNSDDVGSAGDYWSSVVYDSVYYDFNYAYELYFDFDDGVYPQNYNNRYLGYSIRCVARDTVQSHTVTASMDAGVSNVTFTANNITQTATSSNPTVSLTQGVSYTITANLESGYDFSGWSTTSGGSLTSTSTNPTTYTVTGAATLSVTSIQSTPILNYMQDQTSSSMAILLPNVGDTIILYDKRDNTAYSIGKLADNNYWMLDNLALDLTSVSLSTLKGNTNASDTTLTYLKSGGGSSPYTAVAVANKTSGFTGYEIPNINTSYIDTVPPGAPSGGQGSNKVGVYYNYCAASAGSYCYSYTSGTGNATEDICPFGWRMPTGGLSGEYYALYTAYSFNDTDFINALSTPLSGNFYKDSTSYQGSEGDFWSSTRDDTTNMHVLHVYSNSVHPDYNYIRYGGYSVRCIFN